MSKYTYICTECGSSDVSLEAVCVYWDEADQEFTVSDLCDKGHYCNDCDNECRVEQVFICEACLRPEDQCSKAPCPTVKQERREPAEPGTVAYLLATGRAFN